MLAPPLAAGGRCERFPEPAAIFEGHRREHARVAVAAVERVAGDEGGGVGAEDGRLGLAPPEEPRCGGVGGERIERGDAADPAGKEHLAARGVGHLRHHDRHAIHRLERLRPEHAARGGIEGVEVVGIPDHELPHAGTLDHRRGAVAALAGGEGLPPLRTRDPVEGHGHAARTADEAHEQVALDERVAAEAPDRRGRGVVGLEVFRPEQAAGRCIEAGKVALGTEGVDAAVGHRRRAPRPRGIGDRVRAVVLVLPEQPAGGRVEAEQPFGAGAERAIIGAVHQLTLAGHVIHDVDPAVGDGRPRVAACHRHPPLHRQPGGGNRGGEPRLPPDRVTPWPKPLRPVVGPGSGERRHREQGRQCRRNAVRATHGSNSE